MLLDPADLKSTEFYRHMIRIIVPRPIAWVSTLSRDGIPNAAPFSYFSGVGSRPPSLLFCPANKSNGESKDTLRNIETRGEFVVNTATRSNCEAMNSSAAELPADESEFAAFGFTTAPSLKVRPPGIQESPVRIECSLLQVIRLQAGPGGSNIVIGRVEAVHIDDEVLAEDGYADADRLDAVGRMGGAEYCRTTDRFELPRP